MSWIDSGFASGSGGVDVSVGVEEALVLSMADSLRVGESGGGLVREVAGSVGGSGGGESVSFSVTWTEGESDAAVVSHTGDSSGDGGRTVPSTGSSLALISESGNKTRTSNSSHAKLQRC